MRAKKRGTEGKKKEGMRAKKEGKRGGLNIGERGKAGKAFFSCIVCPKCNSEKIEMLSRVVEL